ncbi:alpha/beta hydrolase-fold protein [Streptomyces sp. MCL20-2]|uniref:alpha/beta hydrolase-fold protein n=1 Tax=Streptomyces sp. MCL20-2 TaxID=2967219 RepID=UPI0029662AF4|nr:alpha/beta hydrolase-fold protein [Streptomyces sp. MCL20-2]
MGRRPAGPWWFVSGGTAALYAGLTRPDRFGRVLAQSPVPGGRPGDGAYGDEGPDPAPVVHLGLGPHDGAASVEHGETLVRALRARGYRVHRTVHNGGRDHACRQGLLAEAWWRPSGRSGLRAAPAPGHEFDGAGKPTRRSRSPSVGRWQNCGGPFPRPPSGLPVRAYESRTGVSSRSEGKA